jgi:hypothetical protein
MSKRQQVQILEVRQSIIEKECPLLMHRLSFWSTGGSDPHGYR